MAENGGYQPAHEPNDENRQKVVDLSCNGFSQGDIADYFDIDEKTLRKYYRKELDNSKRDKTIALGNKLYLRALDGDAGAQEFWLKCQGRWSYARPPEEDEDKKKMVTLLERVIDKL